MIGLLGLLSVVAGAVTAYVAERYPAQVEALQTGAGILLVGGFALVATGLPVAL
jgi:hypothetical protein